MDIELLSCESGFFIHDIEKDMMISDNVIITVRVMKVGYLRNEDTWHF